MASSDKPFNEDALYNSFPDGADNEYGPAEGFNVFKKLNDESLFTPDARADPVIQAFLEAPFSVTFAQFKSSTRESEWALHKPHLAMAGEVAGIRGPVDRFPAENPHIGTYLINHDRTMARWKWSVVVIEDGAQAGQMVYKQEDTSQEKPGFGEPRP